MVREDDTEAFQGFAPMIEEKRDQQYVQVMFNNPAKAPLTIELLDERDRVIHTDKVAGGQSYGKSINMKKLRPGTYRVRVSNYDYQYTANVRR